MKQTGFRDIKVSPSGLTLYTVHKLLNRSILEMGGFLNHEIMGPRGVLEIKCPLSINQYTALLKSKYEMSY